MLHHDTDARLRSALEASGQRFTAQRSAVYRFLATTLTHPTAEEVFRGVREDLEGISLATVYKSLETLVGCGLAVKLDYSDGSARYDGRTDPHHHVRCLVCGKVADIAGELDRGRITELSRHAAGFSVTGYRLELSGYCSKCLPEGGPGPISA